MLCRNCKAQSVTENDQYYCNECGKSAAENRWCVRCSGSRLLKEIDRQCPSCIKANFNYQRNEMERKKLENENWEKTRLLIEESLEKYTPSKDTLRLMKRAEEIANGLEIVENLRRLSSKINSWELIQDQLGLNGNLPKVRPGGNNTPQVYVIELSNGRIYVGGSDHDAIARAWQHREAKEFRNGNLEHQFKSSICFPMMKLIHDLDEKLPCFHLAERVLQGILVASGFVLDGGDGVSEANRDFKCTSCRRIAHSLGADWFLKRERFKPYSVQ